uniref:Reverse transcriptase zinc-binding domain-containing protein n=1 Tax=Fagus sylvatica TaxID=28930 RepID=A0A2N9IY24_FAGSY
MVAYQPPFLDPAKARASCSGLHFASLNEKDAVWLERDFDEDEIPAVVKGFNRDNALGSDGFPMFFFQHCWSVVKDDSLADFQEFHMQNSLVGSVYKIIAKVVANRLPGEVPHIESLVHILGCKTPALPMKYLGLPLGAKFKATNYLERSFGKIGEKIGETTHGFEEVVFIQGRLGGAGVISPVTSTSRLEMALVSDFGMTYVHWRLDFVHAVQDWDLDRIFSFLDLLYSTKEQGHGVDTICWQPSPEKGFKDDGETVNHLLLHCPFLKALWDMVFALFGVHWLMPWKYHEDKTRIKDAVKLGKIMLTSTWTLEDFKTAISKDVDSPPVSNVNLKLVFDELLERVREKEEKEAKKRKRLEDDFVHLLCSTKEISASSKWEDCKALFDGSREFRGRREAGREEGEGVVVEGVEVEGTREIEMWVVVLSSPDMVEAKKEKEREEKERRKAKQRREKEEGREKEKDEHFKKDGADSKNHELTDVHVYKENKRSGEDNIKKQRKRHQSSEDNVDENEKDRSRKSHGSNSDHKKSRRHASAPESDNESRHKRHRRDHRNGSRRYGDHEELEDGEFGNDKQNSVDT